ncbi:hypothetical protein ABMY26_18550 [Azospirillum sp. HJ39]|uniref:hypothetical protein n=1 Tax=Azospirillum sp. HJ39 TaxID=3159496 RepID=UPI0035579345
MLAHCRRFQERWGLALALALTLSLLLRLAAPAAGAADRDGYVAICTGSELVYLPADPDGLPLADGRLPADRDTDKQQFAPLHLPCNWLGQYVALLPALQALVLPMGPTQPGQSPKPADIHRPADLKPFQSQAPPSGRTP